MLSRNYSDEYKAASLGRALDRTDKYWQTAMPPTTLGEELAYSFEMGLKSNLTYGLWDLWDRRNEVQSLQTMKPWYREVLQPEQIAIEYPETIMPVKSPKTRAEMEVISARDFRMKALQKVLAGKNTKHDWIPNIVAGFAGGVVDPLGLSIFYGAGHLIPFIPGAKNLLTLRSMASKTMQGRSYAAGILAVDGLVGGLLYNTAQYMTHKKRYMPYGVGEIFENTLMDTAIGAAIGGAFPSVGQHLARAAVPKENIPSLIVGLNHMRRILRSPRWRGSFARYMADEGGAWDLFGIGEMLSGRAAKVREEMEKRLGKVELDDMIFTGVDMKGDVVSRKVKDLKDSTRVYKEVPATVEQLAQRPFRSYGRFSGLKMSGEGVLEFGNIVFKYPKRFYASALHGLLRPQVYKGRVQEAHVAQYRELFAAVPSTSGFHQGSANKVQPLLASTPQGAAYRHLVHGGNLIDGLSEIKVIGLRTKVGAEGLKLFDLDSDNFLDVWNLFVSPKRKHWIPFKNASDLERAKMQTRFFNTEFMDGTSYKVQDEGIEFDAVDLRTNAYQSITGVSDTVLTYDLKRDGKVITGHDVNALSKYMEGMDGRDNPPAVDTLYEAYVQDFEDDIGENLFDTFVKRVKYLGDVRSEFKRYSSLYPQLAHKGTTFNPQTPFRELPRSVWKSVEAAYKRIPGKKDVKIRGWIENMDAVYSKLLGGDEKNVRALTEILKEDYDFRFPTYIHANHPMDSWMVLNDRAVAPLKSKDSILDWVATKKTEEFDDVDIIIPYRDLNLSVSPRTMTREENNILTRLVKDGPNIEINNFDNTTNFVSGAAKVKHFIRENAETFAKLGISNITYKTEGNIIKSKVHEGFEIAGVSVKGKTYRDTFERLKAIPERPEGVAAPAKNEPKDALVAMLETMGSETVGEYGNILNITRDMEKNLIGSSGVGRKVREWGREYVEAGRTLKKYTPSDAQYTKALQEFRTIGRDIQQTYKLLHMILNGGLNYTLDSGRKILQFVDSITSGFGSEAAELLNILNYQPERAYHSFGGYNILSLESSFERQLLIPLFDSLRREGGQDIMKILGMGLLDEDLLKIKYHMMDTVKKQEGTKGTLAEDAREKLQVSDTAWKVYNILVQSMEKSQRMLNEAGYTRTPIKGFIGTRSFDTRRVINTDKDVFAKELSDRSQLNMDEARDIYESFGEIKKMPSDLTGPISRMTRFLESSRKIMFKSAIDELEFLDKYGSVTRAGTDRALGNIGTNSHIMAGVLASITSDSKLAAVTSIMGSRPFFALALADSLLKKKYTEILQKNNLMVNQTNLFGAIKLSVNHFRNVLLSMIMGEPQGMGNLARTRRFLKGATNLNLLPRVGINSVFYDWIVSTRQMHQFFPENNYPWFASRYFFSRFKYYPERKRQEIAKRGYVLLMADTRDYTRRMYGDDMVGLGSWLESKFMDFTGINTVTDGNKTANTVAMGMWMAEAVKLPWEKLTDRVQGLLETHKIDRELWEWFRAENPRPIPYEGVDLLLIGEISEMLDRAVLANKISQSYGDELRLRFDTFFAETAQTKGVPISDLYTRGYFDVNRDDPDGVLHNLGKIMTMYMPTALAAFRSMSDSAYNKTTGKRYDWNAKRVGMMMAHAFVSGAMVTHVGDIAQGREPRDMDNLQFIWESMVRGGVFGILGDFLLGAHNDRKSGFLGNFTGPVISGPIYDAQKALRQLLMLEPLESMEHINKVFWQLFPNVHILDLMANTAFLDSLGDLSGSSESRAIKRRYLQEIGSGYYAD